MELTEITEITRLLTLSLVRVASTLAGTSERGFVDGKDARLNGIVGIDVDDTGNVYVTCGIGI